MNCFVCQKIFDKNVPFLQQSNPFKLLYFGFKYHSTTSVIILIVSMLFIMFLGLICRRRYINKRKIDEYQSISIKSDSDIDDIDSENSDNNSDNSDNDISLP